MEKLTISIRYQNRGHAAELFPWRQSRLSFEKGSLPAEMAKLGNSGILKRTLSPKLRELEQL